MSVDGLKSGQTQVFSSLTQAGEPTTKKHEPKHKQYSGIDGLFKQKDIPSPFQTITSNSPADKLKNAGIKDPSEILGHKHGDKVAEALNNGARIVVKEPTTTTRSISRAALEEAAHADNEELNHLRKEIEERRSAQAREDREFNLISTLVLASSPVGAISLLATLKSTLGELKSPAAIAFASSCMGPLAAMAKDMALIQAKETGSTDMARHLAEALGGSGGAIDTACQCEGFECSDEHIEHLENHIASTETTTTTQEFSLVNPETGEVLLDEHGDELTFEHCECEELDQCEEYRFAEAEARTEVTRIGQDAQSNFEDTKKIVSKVENEKKEKTTNQARLDQIKKEEKVTLSPSRFRTLKDEKAYLKSIIQA